MKKLIIILSVTMASTLAQAGAREAAYKMHNRIAGVPPKADVLNEMTSLIENGDAEGAAEVAMENPGFLSLTIKNWVKPWSNQDQNIRVPLNDYVATIIGVVKDNRPFNSILFDDIIYTSNAAGLDPYSNETNNHYTGAENLGLNFVDTLVMQPQSVVTGLPAAATAGVTTTRNGAENFFSAGTNRRINRYIFINYLCKDFEDVHDITIPDFRVARDVERNPGGDSRTYKNRCVGCHAGQDALRGAYAYYDFSNSQMSYTPGTVKGKMNKNNYFSQGFVTTNDSWINTWATGQNASLGWRGATSGNGAKSLGTMFANSKAFSSCMAKKVFKLVCVKDAKSSSEIAAIAANAEAFESNAYSMKKLIAKTSAGCVNEN